MQKGIHQLFFLVFCLGLVSSAVAQKSAPLQRIQHDHSIAPDAIPFAPSTFLQARTESDLRSQATWAGSVQSHPLPLGPSTSLSILPGKTRIERNLPIRRAIQIDRADDGTVRWMTGQLGRAPLGSGKSLSIAQYTDAALSVLQAYGPTLQIQKPMDEFRSLKTTLDELGYVHARFDQIYKDIPVWGRDVYVHYDADGDIYALNGSYIATPAGLETRAGLSSDAALDVVIANLREDGRWAPLSEETARWLGIEGPEVRLVVYPDRSGRVLLAYEVSLHPNFVEWLSVIVDANTGAILNTVERHCTLYHGAEPVDVSKVTVTLPENLTPGRRAQFLNATGVDLNGQTQNLRVWQADDGTHVLFWDLDNLGQFNIPDLPEDGGGITITANNTDFGENVNLQFILSADNSWTDASSVSAHANMKSTYDYYKGTFTRKAINNQDQSIVSVVHVTEDGQPMDNAFWNGRVMAYGDGDQAFTSLAGALDVASHEMTHGVVEHTAALIYQFQSGALNESFADVFSIFVDRDDFQLGEDIMQPGQGTALRDIANPGDPQLFSPQPATMAQFQNLTIEQDNGGVHINSGIPNKAAHLVIQAIGHADAERIYYRALSNYMHRNSVFGDARKALEMAAADIFGAGSAQQTAVRNAFDAVGITGGTGAETNTGGENNDVPPTTGGSEIIAFVIADASSVDGLPDGALGYMDMQSGESFYFSDAQGTPIAVARLGSQVTAPLNGTSIWYVNQDRKLAMIDLSSGLGTAQNFVFNDFNLQQEGDIDNVSIAPDESIAAVVSAYDNDPTIYFYNGQDTFPFELKPETTQEGIQNESIRYPDVVAWSPNFEQPRVAFDAFQQPGGFGGYWSIFEIDFASSKTYSLIPAQPADISIGNITYANTDPDILAFNTFINDTLDVFLANFETGQAVSLDISSYSVSGVPIMDAERPTFAPNDAAVAFSSAALSGLLIYQFGADQPLSLVSVGVPVFNPHWMLVGGTVSIGTEEEPQVPGSVRLYGNYPNPFNPSTQIRFEVDQPTEVLLQVYDVLGRSVATLVDDRVTTGAHEVRFDAQDLPSGTYMVQLRANSKVQTSKIVLLR